MNIVFAGTPQFAADHLKLLVDSQHEIKCILTQPDRGSGRGKKVMPSPVKEIGINNGIEVLQPNSLKDESIVRSLESLKPDILLVVAYGLLIPKKVLDIAEIGSINVHASILPRWRGAAPIEYSIYSGDNESGISYMRMTEGLDEGPTLEIHKCKIEKDVLQGINDEAPTCDKCSRMVPRNLVEMKRVYKPNAKPGSKDGSWGFKK